MTRIFKFAGIGTATTLAALLVSAAAHADAPGSFMGASTCRPEWRPLVSGPAGREVAPLCSGQALLPLPEPVPKRPPPLLLPTPLDLAPSLTTRRLDAQSLPAEPAARSASLAVLQGLDAQTMIDTSHSVSVAQLTTVDPLGWSVAPRQLHRWATGATSQATSPS